MDDYESENTLPKENKEKYFYIEKFIERKIYGIDNLMRKDLPDDWKLPELPKLPKKPPIVKPAFIEEILAPLDRVFISDGLKDEIVTRVSIPELVEGGQPSYSGVILFGPPGTGKTVLLGAIAEVYKRAGAYAEEVSFSRLNSAFVGQFARNLEEVLTRGLAEAENRKRPSFLSFDEGSILVESASSGATSVSKHYQEAIDILKRYIGNQRELVIAVSTNLLPEDFEDALTREGRLTSFFIGFPDVEQRKRMWKHFAEKYEVAKLSDEQAYNLADLTDEEQVAFIEEFCRGYLGIRRAVLLKDRGFSTLVDALKKGVNVKEDEIRGSISYETLVCDVNEALQSKYQRNGVKREEEKVGFVAPDVKK